MAGTAKELQYSDPGKLMERLLSSGPGGMEFQVLAAHLTVGETYFFRERKALEALAARILPGLIRERENEGRRLRVWSAACCTGEEAYSLAILLRQAIPKIERLAGDHPGDGSQ
ncbi:MAG: CheR family methyltransferase [Chthoniobacteraceae bacterium]